MIKMNYKKPCIISLGKFSDLSILMAVRFPIKVLLWSQKGFFLKSSFHCKKKEFEPHRKLQYHPCTV